MAQETQRIMITAEKIISLAGVYGMSSETGRLYDLKLPGTLDESGIGSEYFDFSKIENTKQGLFMVTVGYKFL